MKKFVWLIAWLSGLLLLAGCIRLPADPGAGEGPSSDAPTVTLSIRCDAALKSDQLSEDIKGILPQDGVILPATLCPYTEGMTVYDLLISAGQTHGIAVAYAGVGEMKYIRGIAGLFEFDAGSLSGWLFRVNGTVMSSGSSQYPLKAGDTVEWLYTCDLGNDLEEYPTFPQ